ncbi:DNA repair protein complementing XP-C cells-like protein [Smittium mucronatum]|uniref:DNA repair protein complementing XP-C cells-like protein n=1 Tax=Smittium mucronatum TaxID=133383 RepID=A0A1R0GPQ5_9FUNG|nr:DNA repair protein complementing XP-C cells-like protein [Smittium mucronatum]OLY80314.1 DNA repair protein complementing XP-C cells-like protein [Smittium mucronatum]
MYYNRASKINFFRAWSISLIKRSLLNKLENVSKSWELGANEVQSISLLELIPGLVACISQFFSKLPKFSAVKDKAIADSSTNKGTGNDDICELITQFDYRYLYLNSDIIKPVILASVLRAYGIKCRLCFALKPISPRPKIEQTGEYTLNRQGKNKSIVSWCEVATIESPAWNYLDFETGRILKDVNLKYLCNPNDPYMYIIGVDNKGHISDITLKYSSNINILKNKEKDWWYKVISRFEDLNSGVLDKVDEGIINDRILNQPIPNKISDFVNHAEFALKDHLKNNQIIEKDAQVLGYFRGKPIYPRKSILELHSSAVWERMGESGSSKVSQGKSFHNKKKKRGRKEQIRGSGANNTTLWNMANTRVCC